MVFSSPPLYLDPPNWHHQQANHQPEGVGSSDHDQNLHHHQLLQAPLMPQMAGGVGSSVRPGSMAERARLAKLPQPETALKCPRCDSTNTKFCYFNNYSLSQPRHFCKTCRRYWTRGGTLRNVPVGGGCRRNKRSKSSSRSKSPGGVASSSSVASGAAAAADILSHLPPQIPFHLPPLNQISDYGGTGEIGLNYGALHHHPPLTATTAAASGMLSEEQWRMHNQQQQQVQQFPFLAAAASGLFHGGGGGDSTEPSYLGGGASRLGSKQAESGVTHQVSTVKFEGNNNSNNNQQQQPQGLGLGSSSSSRNFLGIGNLAAGVGSNEQYSWVGGATPWNSNDLTGFTSSTSHLL